MTTGWTSRLRAFAVYILVFLSPLPASAQETMTEIQPLGFGLFSLRDNDSPHDLVINAGTGGVTADPEFIVATPPQRGEYLLEGFVPGTEIDVTVDDGALTLGGGGGAEAFATISYTVSPSPVIADGAGEATVLIGATLRTNGDTTLYPGGIYSDDIDITFDWIP